MNRLCGRAIRGRSLTSSTMILCRPAPTRRSFHPEPRSFQNSAHGTHRFVYRWVIQAIGTPFAVAYLCDQVSERSEGGENSFRLELPGIDRALWTEPIRAKSQTWGQIRLS
ncbi:hypothetical protein PV04_10731 [Phialophora macrospora]|uniref:Uncharacterized protein n=1 Tax=Phialophora macrospora TaxID=1851006 RepID=A0A0D2FRF6_9EURO|nr:hypothetical protein PV04_10731 [Phialophora macrospora]